MYTVTELPIPDRRTRLWLSDQAIAAIDEHAKQEKKPGFFLEKLTYWCRAGLPRFEPDVVRSEGNGVFRIGYNDLFRLIGFYEDDHKKDFIVIAAITKHGKKLRANERRAIRDVAEVKAKGDWKRVTQDGNYPRIAKDAGEIPREPG